jgi:hypothetical protein
MDLCDNTQWLPIPPLYNFKNDNAICAAKVANDPANLVQKLSN